MSYFAYTKFRISLCEVTFLFCVCFVEKESSSSIKLELMNKLSENYSILWIEKKNCIEFGEGKPLIFINSKDFKKLDTKNCILVFDEDAKLNISDINLKNIIAIVNSSSTNQISELSKLNIPVITCGASQKDTFTYSSYTEDEVSVSLQRSFSSQAGKIIEPFEVPVNNMVNNSIYSVLAYIAIRAEFDDIEKNYL